MDLIGPYSNYIRQQNQGGAIIKNNVSLTRISMIYLDTGWFKIFEIPTYDLYEVTGVNDEYIDK